jgi:cell division protein FtsA
MSNHRNGLTPKLTSPAYRKGAILGVLDVGTTKVACLIARLERGDAADVQAGRPFRCRVLGIGHQRSQGLKGGVVVDMDGAERCIRQAIDSAERMAKVQVDSLLVTLTGGRIQSHHFNARIGIGSREISDRDLRRVMDAATGHTMAVGRSVLHSLPVGYELDGARGIRDPRGMLGNRLGVDMHVATCDTAAARNLMLVVERCHVTVEALVATPYASGLSVLIDDEAEMGAACIDMGGGTTSVGIFSAGRLLHLDAIAVGGNHITMDVARGLSMRLDAAERLKGLSGSCLDAASDERDMIAIPQMGDEERGRNNHIPRSQLTRIIRPRCEETLELLRDRMRAAGIEHRPARGAVLTGGACQLEGLPALASKILDMPVRIGRPQGVKGLPESAKNPAFAGAVGMLVYPEVAGFEHVDWGRGATDGPSETDGYLTRMGRWLKNSF